MALFVRRHRVAMPVAGLFAALASLTIGHSAIAAPPEGGALASCAGDLQKLCGGIEAGGGKKMRCLMQNEAQLSPACDTAVKARIDARSKRLGGPDLAQAPSAQQPSVPGASAPAATMPVAPKAGKVGRLGNACQSELTSLCGTETGGKRMKCLMTNEAKLGPACAAAVTERKQKRDVAKAACVTDAATFCATSKGPERMSCLQANKAKLTPTCLARVEKREAAPPKQ